MDLNAEPIRPDEIADGYERALIGGHLWAPEMRLPPLLAEEFFLDRHRVIWQVLGDMTEDGENPSLPGLVERLRQTDQLQAAGGLPAVATLFEEGTWAVPSLLAGYAERVREAATRRAVRRLGQELTAHGLSAQEIEERLLAMPTPLALRLAHPRDRWREVQARWGKSGFRIGLPEVDRKLGGLYPGDLVVVGGRPSHGKTSCLVSLALHALVEEGMAVAYLTLEMSAAATFRRFLGARARLRLVGLRSGALGAMAFELADQTAEWLARQPLAILDARDLGGKAAERLLVAAAAAEAPIVVIDHLQEVTTEGESRAYELGRFIGALKEVAIRRDKVILVAAQLLRQADERHGPSLGLLKECVAGGTEILLPDGRRQPVEHCHARQSIATVRGQCVEPVAIRTVVSKGDAPVRHLRLSLGRDLYATATHLVLTDRGWKRLDELQVGDHVATVRRLPMVGALVLSPRRARFLGYMTGDGFSQRARILGFINSDPDLLGDVEQIVAAEFPSVHVRRRPVNGSTELRFVGSDVRGIPQGSGNPIRVWLRQIECYGHRHSDKRTPPVVFQCSATLIAEYLAGLFLTDGTVTGDTIALCSTSVGLIEDVRMLLARLGIASTHGGGYRSRKARRLCFKLAVITTDLERFRLMIPLIGRKAKQLTNLPMRATRCSADVLPPAFTEELERARGTISRQMFYGTKNRPRRMTRRRARALNCTKLSVRQWTESDLIWGRVLAVEEAGSRPVYDLVVPRTHCFIANGVVVHNSGGIEEKADIVLLLDYPIKRRVKEADQEELLVYVAKNRDGGTGRVRVRILAEYGLVMPPPDPGKPADPSSPPSWVTE